jgi:hypothetical protein
VPTGGAGLQALCFPQRQPVVAIGRGTAIVSLRPGIGDLDVFRGALPAGTARRATLTAAEARKKYGTAARSQRSDVLSG